MGVESRSELPRRTGKVLVVDDSSTFRRAVSAMVERAGFAVTTAASGEEAFTRCFEESFDLVVSDVTMSGLSGVQLCRLFRSDPATKDVPVLLLTAADDPRSRFWARHAGAAAYVAKERARADLIPEMMRVLSRKPVSIRPLRTRAGRRAQPMERLSQVLDELLFRAVISTEVRDLIHHTGDRRRFSIEFLQIAAAVADYAYLVLQLKGIEQASYSVHARGPWPTRPGPRTLELLELPCGIDDTFDVICEGSSIEGVDPGLEAHDKARFTLKAAGEHVGSLIAVGKDKRLGGEDRATLELLAKELGILVKNMWLIEETQRLADSDALTGLQNRRRATQRMELELSRSRRYGTAFSVLLCDVDHFKSVNDRFGHNMGDEVLTRVARTLQHSLRQVDLAGRWGGEEFLVLLPDTDAEGARVIAERLRAAVEAIPAFEGGPERVTWSIGGASFAGEDSATAFLERADQALYRAKERGRNRVELG